MSTTMFTKPAKFIWTYFVYDKWKLLEYVQKIPIDGHITIVGDIQNS